jgi:endonuclease/exonuclease/phosphatase (EEP) superfamily protein YafD
VSDVTASATTTETTEAEQSEPGPRPRPWRTVLAWAGVAGWGIWAVVLLAGGDRIPGIGVFAAPLLAFTPFVAAATPVPVAVALGLRRWWAAAVAGAVAVVLVGSVAPRALGGGQPDARGPVVRVLSFNTYFGMGDARELIDLVRRTRADVLSLQEVGPESADRYEAAGLKRLLPHSVVDARRGAAGSGLYSRYPLRELPQPSGMAFATPQAELTLPGGRRMRVAAVHPVPPVPPGTHQLWKHDIEALPPASEDGAGPGVGPVRVLAGDFNSTLDHAVLRGLIGRGYADAGDRAGRGLVPTWGTGDGPAPITIDHVLVDERSAVTGYEVYDITGSDHRAVYAEIRLP